MNSARQSILWTAGLLLSLGVVHAEDLVRTVEFRDGTVLTVTLPDANVSATLREDGAVKPAQLKLSDLSELAFAKKPQLDEGKRFAALIEDLGNDDFTVRENAERDLRAAGTNARADLDAASTQELDPETKARVVRLRSYLPPPSELETAGGYFDPVTFTATHKKVQADTAGLSLIGTYQGHAVKLDRTTVAKLRLPAATVAEAPPPTGPVTTRIAEDGPEAFGKDTTRIDFETAPDGTALTAGMDIGQTFVPKGFTLATSYEDSFVSVNNYNVRGPSGGNSCATHNPLWNGVVTIRFCVPGQPKVPAGVTRVGLWIAEVAPDGTALEAYDSRGQRIAEIKVVKQGNDFLGVRSSVPIAYVKIVPNMAIDPNYTFDDLVYDTPRPFTFVPHEKLFTIQTRQGNKILAKSTTVSVTTSKLHSTDLAVGIETLDLPLADVATVLTPMSNWKVQPLVKGCWLKLRDGSVLHAGLEDGPVCTRLPLKVSPQTVSAMWGDAGEFVELPPKVAIPEGGGVYVDKKGSLAFTAWKFGKQFIDEPHFHPEGDPDQRWSLVRYETAATTWFSPDPVIAATSGRILLLTGETFVLGTDSTTGFTLEAWTEAELIVKHGTDLVRIPVGEILSVTLPTK